MRARERRTFFALARRSFPICFGGIWLVCGVPFLVIGIYVTIDTMRLQDRFTNEAQVVQGMVLTKRIHSGNKSGNKETTSYLVGYRFRASDGTVVRSETKVSGTLWDRLVEREPVQVTYLPDQPRTHRIEEQGPDWIVPLIFTVLGILLVPTGGWIFSRGVRGIVRELRLQRRTA